MKLQVIRKPKFLRLFIMGSGSGQEPDRIVLQLFSFDFPRWLLRGMLMSLFGILRKVSKIVLIPGKNKN
jgi:hypothetical protein